MHLNLKKSLFIGIMALSSVASAGVSGDATQVDPAGSCSCPEGYLPFDGGCCPECFFLDPPCLAPCLGCQDCGHTGDVCDYSAGLTCCDGPHFCCPDGAQSTCSDVACAQ